MSTPPPPPPSSPARPPAPPRRPAIRPPAAPRAEAIFDAALDLPLPEREGFLVAQYGGDEGLEKRVRALLAVSAAAPDFLEAPPMTPEFEEQLARLKPEEAGEVIGPYKLREQIGEGGFGTVWVADQEKPVRRRVALKIIKMGMDTKEVIARFEQERQALAMMDHPNIAKILDAGVTQWGRPFFVMELVRGLKITDYCDEKKLSTQERVELFITVCQAVQHAHQKGIIHRDLKPSNILVTVNDGKAVPKVIDFGVAKATQGRLTDATVYTQFQQMIGTPLYMSPEQAEMTSLDIDTRSDIYALGVLLYELLTGHTPIEQDTLARVGLDEIRRLIREVDPPRPSMRMKTLADAEMTTAGQRRNTEPTKLAGTLRGDIDWIVMKCLEKDRARRYDTANGLALDLQRHLANEVVIARPPTAGYLLSKLIRRNKLAFTAGAAIAASLVIGIAASVWQAVRATRAEREQSQLREVAVKALDGEKEQRTHAEAAQQRADTEARKASENEQQARRFLYASDMNLAQQSLKQNNLGKVRGLLERHRPKTGEEDLRGWEWRYLWQLTRSSALVTLANRPVRGYSVSFSPDGTRLAVGWFDGGVDLWDVPGRRKIRALTEKKCDYSGKVAFAPKGNLLAATSESNTVALYDLDSGRESILWRAPNPKVWVVRDLAFSSDGSKLVVFAETIDGDDEGAVWIVNVASARVENRHPTGRSPAPHTGAARISHDNRRLFLGHASGANGGFRIECLDLAAGKEAWQTELQADDGITALALSPDGRVLASGSGFQDPTIRIWDATTGRLLSRLEGHTAWVCQLAFTSDGLRLISAGSDQSIRIWDTTSWTESRVLHGHTDEVHSVAISEPAQLIASASKDGDLMLWRDDGKRAADGYQRLPEGLGYDEILPLDGSRVLLLPPDRVPEVRDLRSDLPAIPLSEIGSSSNVLGYFEGNRLCHWNGTDKILISELQGVKLVERGRIPLASATRPTGRHYSSTGPFVAWTQPSSPTAVYCAKLAEPGRRIELRNDLPGLVHFSFGKDGKHLAATTKDWQSFRLWNIETGSVVVSQNGPFGGFAFSGSGRAFAVSVLIGPDHETQFYDLDRPGIPPRRVPGKHHSMWLAASPEGRMVVAATHGGLLQLMDPVAGTVLDSIHGHLNSAAGVCFSPDGRRLTSSHGGWDAVKLWDLHTRQELLNLSGHGSILAIKWSTDGNVILAGEPTAPRTPWQAWSAPSWEEIAAAEAKEKAEGKQR